MKLIGVAGEKFIVENTQRRIGIPQSPNYLETLQ